ncbi:transmembrane protein 61 [Columba livia]|uniref:Transmembrane protein 61 n=1 Tax=Columba livia TaxID=8932 RepID=A0A2I0MCC7_COLLI|nr:transmembrane protein 61 isoform X2 [Columba livia]PKK27337.1 transmembrane protein 61 [Columba livia]
MLFPKHHHRTWALSCLASLFFPCKTSSQMMAAASFRYGVTITGAVLLVTGTLCFAWWSDREVGSPAGGGTSLLPPREAEVVPSSSSSALLRSASFFCCGIGGILLLFGLLWSVKANARVVSRRYQYHFPRDLQYFTAEPPEKWNCSTWDSSAIPTYEEALTCRPAQGVPTYVQPPGRKEELTPPLYYLEEDESWQGSRRRRASDSALFRPSSSWLETQHPGEPQATPPPSYENISIRGV